MNKWFAVAAVVVLCLALVIGVGCGGDDENGNGNGDGDGGVTELKFGFGLALGGMAGAVVGVPNSYAQKMAADDIGVFEVGGKQYRWKPIHEDNEFTTAGGALTAAKFIYEDDVDFMWQMGVDPSNAAYDYCHEAEIILDASGLSLYQLGPEKPYLFQTGATLETFFAHFFDWLSREHPEAKKVVFAMDDTAGQAASDVFSGACEYYGLEYTSILYPYGTMEFYPVATRIMAEKPDLIYVDQRAYDVLWEMGYEGLFVSAIFSETMYGPLNWAKAAGHVVLTGPHQYGPWPEVRAFKARFEEEHGMEAILWPCFAYETLFVWTEVIKQAGTVDDVDEIVETAETAVFEDTPYGACFFGGEELNGIGHILVLENAVSIITGEGEFELLEHITAEENGALTVEIYGGK